MFVKITSQGGISKGYFSVKDLNIVKLRISELLNNLRIPLCGFYYCIHDTNGNVEGSNRPCSCQKPLPGMLVEAASDHFIDLNQSWIIGDTINDVEAGNRAGCQTILIDNGGETEWLPGVFRKPDFKARNINEAAEQI
ncbi:MAG: HAD-IIIA family hydrolase [Flavobacterium sp.]|nr:HAD-IIIA family hydrolase [Pedobacter sp.]